MAMADKDRIPPAGLEAREEFPHSRRHALDRFAVLKSVRPWRPVRSVSSNLLHGSALMGA
jgi:hypothetical protein